MNVHPSRATGASAAVDEAAIRAVIERVADGFRTLDLDAIMACHTEDVVCFDCHSRFEARGAQAVRAFLEACFPHMQPPMVYEVHDLTIATGGDIAFAHYALRSSSRDAQGGEHGGWLRVTAGFRRTDAGWLGCHAHISAPFDPMSGRTMFGLPRDANPFESNPSPESAS